MATLPSSSSFTGSSVTEADFKAAITQLRDFLSGILGTGGTQITALQALGAILSNRTQLSSTTSITTSHRGHLLRCTAGITLNLLSAASAGNGFCFAVRNDSDVSVTIDANLSETIDGETTISLTSGESAFFYCNGTGWHTISRSVGGDGEFRQLRVYSSIGSTSWPKPAGLKRVRVTVQGGGGGGGAGSEANPGGNAGSGGFAIKVIEAGALGSSETVTVGAGGAANTGSNSGTGGTSSFGAHVSCTGGVGGERNTGISGAGGSASGGDINIEGQAGAPSGCTPQGGSSPLGVGGFGRISGAASGVTGTGFGSGGGRGMTTSTNTASGRQGIVIIEEFF